MKGTTMNFRNRKWYMEDGLSGRHPHLCFADGDEENPPGGGDDNAKLLADLQAQIDALKGMKGAAVDESKAEREKRKAAEAELAKYKEAERLAEEEAAKARGEHEKLLAAKAKEADELKARLATQTRETALKDAVGSIDLAPEVKGFVEAKFRDQVKIEDGVAVIDGKPVSEFMKGWSETDEGKYFIRNDASGGGASGGKGSPDETKKPEEMTATEQSAHYAALLSKDPVAARNFAIRMGWETAA
jgi:hypothetical protein